MYSCLPFVDDSVYCWGKTRRKCCIVLWKCVYIKCPVEEGMMMLLWFFSESSITYMVLYSIYLSVLFFFFFFKVCWSFENVSILNNGALIGLREKKKWRHPFFDFKKKKKKGKPLALITSYHFIQQHQVSVFHSALYCSALWICCCELCWRNIYKDLAFIIWFLFSPPHSTYTV